jgi:putative phosphoesterase
MSISDLHINSQTQMEMQEALLQIADEQGVDVLVIAGDISDDIILTKKFVQILNRDLKTYYVPGNHDLWTPTSTQTTSAVYDEFLADEYCLLNKAQAISEQTIIIGHIGWYDYSFASAGFTFADLIKKEHKGIVWEDTRYIDFPTDDVSLCAQYNQEIEQLLKQHETKQTVLVTHMVNHERFLVKYTKRRDWNYFQGYLGSYRLQEIAHEANVAICGHVHYRGAFFEDDTLFVCSCLGLEAEWQYFLKNQPLIEQVAHASFFANLV